MRQRSARLLSLILMASTARACPSCAAENPARAQFCMSCGTPLTPRCAGCGAENPEGARFCIECGSALAEPGAAAPAPSAVQPAPAPQADKPEEERRQASVLFADLSGYTAAAERMDPEAVKALVDRTLRRLGEEIERFGARSTSSSATT